LRAELIVRSLATLLLPVALQGQARCTDPLADAHWRSTPLSAMISAPAQGERDVDRYVAGIVPLLAQSFRDPAAAAMPAAGALGVVAALEERTPIRATLAITFDRNGKVLGAALSLPTGDAKLDSALTLAARGAGGGRGFGKVPRKFKGDTLHVTIEISDRFPGSPMVSALGTTSVPYLVADVAPRLKSMPTAHAPRGRRGREVTLAATVNSAGRIVLSTVRLVSTNDPSLVPIARASFERSTYTPGTRHGCPAESYIRQRFPFP
jgi:hypothetical protein